MARRPHLGWIACLAAVLAPAGASAQVAIFSGAGASAGLGSGARTVFFHGGRYYVFFFDGTAIQFTSSADGATFCPAEPVVAAGGDQGFSTAVQGDRLALAYGHFDGSQYTLTYAEATLPAAPTGCHGLAFAGTVLTGSPSASERGYAPVVAFSAQGVPTVGAIELDQPYNGSLKGCKVGAYYRPTVHYLGPSGWAQTGYCRNYAAVRDPSATTFAALSNGNVVIGAVLMSASSLNTSVVDPRLALPVGELGEPSRIVADADSNPSSVTSVTLGTDVHYAYRSYPGGEIAYARQDGTLTGPTDPAAEVAIVAASGGNAAISRPSAAGGCYTIAWLSGTEIRKRTFTGSVATIGAESVVFTRAAAPTSLTLELESATAPAMVWQEGTTIYFAVPPAVAAPTVVASPASAPADGTTVVNVDLGPFADACGNTVPDGTLITVAASAGTFSDSDADPATAGLQLSTTGGSVAAHLVAPSLAATSTVTGLPAAGGTVAVGAVDFVAVGDAGIPAGADASAAGPDAAAPGLDAASADLDAASAGPDAAGNGWDALAPGPDGSVPEPDAANPETDGSLVEDVGAPEDGALAVVDAAASSLDAGEADVGGSPADAAEPPDGEPSKVVVVMQVGCTCGAASGWSPGLGLVALLALGWRRRRPASSPS